MTIYNNTRQKDLKIQNRKTSRTYDHFGTTLKLHIPRSDHLMIRNQKQNLQSILYCLFLCASIWRNNYEINHIVRGHQMLLKRDIVFIFFKLIFLLILEQLNSFSSHTYNLMWPSSPYSSVTHVPDHHNILLVWLPTYSPRRRLRAAGHYVFSADNCSMHTAAHHWLTDWLTAHVCLCPPR